ncbi:MAG: signal recognition particle-docking protein FtsY [Desulfuromonas sp.]|nr:signal recognition particle-docking protein FtsY [Desulfuromonas sp.]
MQWSEIMQQVYQFWGHIAEIVLMWLAQLELWCNQLLQQVVEVLARLGVPQQWQMMAAYGCFFAVATLLVLLFIWRVVRRRSRQRPKRPAAESADAEATAQEQEVAAGERLLEDISDAEVAAAPATPAAPLSLFARMKAGLSKTQVVLLGQIDTLFSSSGGVNDAFIEELEEILISADFGMKTTQLLVDAFKKRVAQLKVVEPNEMRQVLKEEILRLLTLNVATLDVERTTPFVIMVVGVNGVGKTTTIGKLAQQFTQQGKKVILGAGDTFRAAAADQLEVWGERTGVTVIRHAEGSDPAAVAFDAVKATVARKADVLILDTAGRLHTKVNLMEEMKKIYRVMGREIPDAPHETLLVLDATTGQNALVQARLFQEAVGVTGVAITKLDGTAKGGMAVAIGAELGLPVRYIGIGEGVDDLRPFDAQMFVDALFENH